MPAGNNGAGYDIAFDEGHNVTAMRGLMREYSALFGADTGDHRLYARALSSDWLPSAVMSVANASAVAETALVMGASEDRVEDREFREKPT